jgi:hypothetical protein
VPAGEVGDLRDGLRLQTRVNGEIAAVAPRYRLPQLPWPIPASALSGCAETAHPASIQLT